MYVQLTYERAQKLRRGAILYLKDAPHLDVYETVKFANLSFSGDKEIIYITHKEKFVKGGWGQVSHACHQKKAYITC